MGVFRGREVIHNAAGYSSGEEKCPITEATANLIEKRMTNLFDVETEVLIDLSAAIHVAKDNYHRVLYFLKTRKNVTQFFDSHQGKKRKGGEEEEEEEDDEDIIPHILCDIAQGQSSTQKHKDIIKDVFSSKTYTKNESIDYRKPSSFMFTKKDFERFVFEDMETYTNCASNASKLAFCKAFVFDSNRPDSLLFLTPVLIMTIINMLDKLKQALGLKSNSLRKNKNIKKITFFFDEGSIGVKCMERLNRKLSKRGTELKLEFEVNRPDTIEKIKPRTLSDQMIVNVLRVINDRISIKTAIEFLMQPFNCEFVCEYMGVQNVAFAHFEQNEADVDITRYVKLVDLYNVKDETVRKALLASRERELCSKCLDVYDRKRKTFEKMTWKSYIENDVSTIMNFIIYSTDIDTVFFNLMAEASTKTMEEMVCGKTREQMVENLLIIHLSAYKKNNPSATVNDMRKVVRDHILKTVKRFFVVQIKAGGRDDLVNGERVVCRVYDLNMLSKTTLRGVTSIAVALVAGTDYSGPFFSSVIADFESFIQSTVEYTKHFCTCIMESIDHPGRVADERVCQTCGKTLSRSVCALAHELIKLMSSKDGVRELMLGSMPPLNYETWVEAMAHPRNLEMARHYNFIPYNSVAITTALMIAGGIHDSINLYKYQKVGWEKYLFYKTSSDRDVCDMKVSKFLLPITDGESDKEKKEECLNVRDKSRKDELNIVDFLRKRRVGDKADNNGEMPELEYFLRSQSLTEDFKEAGRMLKPYQIWFELLYVVFNYIFGDDVGHFQMINALPLAHVTNLEAKILFHYTCEYLKERCPDLFVSKK